MTTFDDVSREYGEKSILQQKAARKLVDLLELRGDESILDVGCGPGHIIRWLSEVTTGRVVGTDASQGMINEARSRYPDIEFRCLTAEDLDYAKEFDIIFSNAAFHWFGDPGKGLRAMFEALRSPGKLGLTCSATAQAVPWFAGIVIAVAQRREIQPTFLHWRNPWFILPKTEDYRGLFEESGFETSLMTLELGTEILTVEEAYGFFATAAATGFLGRANYDIEIDDSYIEAFGRAVHEEMEKQSVGGNVEVGFSRLYYVGLKPRCTP
jgi:trans-aconitate methyltransferase